MKLRHLVFAAAALAVTATQARAQGFTDTWIGLRDGPFISNPGEEKGGRNVNKIIASVGHFDAGAYGSNFFSVDALLSNANEPANNSAGGSTEFYGVYRGQFSPDYYLGIPTKIGPFQAINLEVGVDLEAEDSAFAPDKKAFTIGPNFHIDVPAGFLDIGTHLYKEINNNSICHDACATGSGGPVNFSLTGEFEIVWLFPLGFTGLPLDFRGFTNIVLPKGKDGFGNQTAVEVLARPQINLDVGKMAFNKPNKLYLYLQLELWDNKFGNDHTIAGNSGTQEISPVFGIEYHF